MILNLGKCHYIVFYDNHLSHKIILNNKEIGNSNEEKLSGVRLDSKLNFNSHIISLCKKAGPKCGVLGRRKHYFTPGMVAYL